MTLANDKKGGSRVGAGDDPATSRDIGRQVLEIEAEAIRRMIDRLDDSFERALEFLCRCRGRVVTTGMGKSGIICRKSWRLPP